MGDLMRPEPTHWRRREALKFGGAIGALALAGCTSQVPIGGGGSDYADWLYAPGTVNDVDHYGFSWVRPATLDEHEDELAEDTFSSLERVADNVQDIVDIDLDEMEGLLRLNFEFPAVITGSFDVEDLAEDLEDADYDDEGDHEGFTIFLSSDEFAAVGVSDSAVIVAGPGASDDADEVVEIVIDTSLGEEDRYAEESDDFAELERVLDVGEIAFGLTEEEADDTDVTIGRFENMVARGISWGVSPDVSNMQFVIVFEDEDDIDIEEVEEWIDETDSSGDTFDDVDDISVNQRGRSVEVTGQIDTDDISAFF